MNLTFYERPLFYIGQHYVSTLGLMAFGALFTFGLILARFLQSEWVRRLFSRFKLETNFIAIVTTILSLASLVFFTITAINAAGLPLAWSAPLPGIKLSLINIFLLIVMLVAVFWLSSRTKRFLFTNLLANSGLNRSLQYALSQIISNIVLVIGVILVLENTGIHLGALAVFAGAVGVGVGVGLQGIASNFISGLIILAERPITIGDRVQVGDTAGRCNESAPAAPLSSRTTTSRSIVPNKKFIDETVTNWTYGDPRVRFRVPVGVAYGSDVEKVHTALTAAGRQHPKALTEPAPSVFLEKFGDSSIDFELVVWSSEMSHRPHRFRSDLNFLIERQLREAGIEIPNPQRDIYIRSGSIAVTAAAAHSEVTPGASVQA